MRHCLAIGSWQKSQLGIGDLGCNPEHGMGVLCWQDAHVIGQDSAGSDSILELLRGVTHAGRGRAHQRTHLETR